MVLQLQILLTSNMSLSDLLGFLKLVLAWHVKKLLVDWFLFRMVLLSLPLCPAHFMIMAMCCWYNILCTCCCTAFLAFILYVWEILTSVVWNLPFSLLPTALYYLQRGSNLLLYKSCLSALNFMHSLCHSVEITFLSSFLSIASSVVCKRQKQPLKVFCKKRCSLKFHKIRKKTHLP